MARGRKAYSTRSPGSGRHRKRVSNLPSRVFRAGLRPDDAAFGEAADEAADALTAGMVALATRCCAAARGVQIVLLCCVLPPAAVLD